MSISFGGDGVDDPSDFQALAFQQLDEHLRCPICKEFFDTTMILSNCSHSFCALCIRRSLTAEQICPKCRKPASDLDLLHNYDLDHVVGTWKKSR
jgi:E3 ubiquitin-protein ligase RAD18